MWRAGSAVAITSGFAIAAGCTVDTRAMSRNHVLSDNAFDLWELESEDLSGLPRIERKERLSALIAAGEGTIRYSEHIQGQARSC
jgi:ATP-dependent DNA ligase